MNEWKEKWATAEERNGTIENSVLPLGFTEMKCSGSEDFKSSMLLPLGKFWLPKPDFI